VTDFTRKDREKRNCKGTRIAKKIVEEVNLKIPQKNEGALRRTIKTRGRGYEKRKKTPEGHTNRHMASNADSTHHKEIIWGLVQKHQTPNPGPEWGGGGRSNSKSVDN